MTRKIVLASRNEAKLAELRRILAAAGLGVELVGLPPGEEVAETGATFADNALLKARAAAGLTGLPAVADDSGLAVDALGGAPDVLSARYAGEHGDDEANNRKLLEVLKDIPDDHRGAAFVCALALADPSGAIRLETEAACRGRITHEPRGANGFGYDPLFLISEYHKTFGELSALVKHQLSHRARAFARLRPEIERLIATGDLGRV